MAELSHIDYDGEILEVADESARSNINSHKSAVANSSTRGHVKLSSSVSSSSDVSAGIAATPLAVKKAYEKAETAESLAKGRNQARVFETTAEMNAWLSNAENKGVANVGDNIYIVEPGSVDWWIVEVLDAPNSSGMYYNIAQLENEKVDLTDIEKDIKAINDSLGDEDISEIGDGTATGAIKDINVRLEVAINDITQTYDSKLPGSYAGGLKINEIEGYTIQYVTNGDQLLNIHDSLFSSNGLSPIIQEDGGIRVVGTPTTAYTVIANKTVELESGTYYIGGGETGAGKIYAQANITHSDGTQSYYSSGRSFVVADGDTVKVSIQCGSELGKTDYVIYPMLCKGSKPMPFEKYTGGSFSPSIPYPQEFDMVAKKGSLKITVSGKNLFAPDSTDYVTGLTIDKNNMVFSNNKTTGTRLYYMPCKPNTKYSYSKTLGATVRLFSCPDIPVLNGAITVVNEKTGDSISITTGANDKYICIYPLWSTEIDNISWEEMVHVIQIEEGDVTPFEPYKANSKVIPLEGRLGTDNKIVVQDGLWGVFIRTRVKTFGGKWSKRTEMPPNDGSTCYSSADFITDNARKSDMYMACTHLTFGGTITGISDIKPLGKANKFYKFHTNGTASGTGTTMYVCSDETTLDDFLAKMEGAEFEYELDTPVFEPFPADVQIALNSLLTYDGVSYISTDSELEPVISVDYGITETGAFALNNYNAGCNAVVHAWRKDNPHGVTKDQLGLGNVQNTTDSEKSVKYAASAGSAGIATKAAQDGNGNNIANTYARKDEIEVRYDENTDYLQILYNGEWHNFKKACLQTNDLMDYEAFSKYVGSIDITGAGGGPNEKVNVSITCNTTLDIVADMTGQNVARISVVTQPIDLTHYTKLVLSHATTATASSSYEAASVFITNALTANITPAASASMLRAVASSGGTIELDVSALNGEYIIGICFQTNGKSITTKISEIYLT